MESSAEVGTAKFPFNDLRSFKDFVVFVLLARQIS